MKKLLVLGSVLAVALSLGGCATFAGMTDGRTSGKQAPRVGNKVVASKVNPSPAPLVIAPSPSPAPVVPPKKKKREKQQHWWW